MGGLGTSGGTWGRSTNGWSPSVWLQSAFPLLAGPFLVWFLQLACHAQYQGVHNVFDSSISAVVQAFVADPRRFFAAFLPREISAAALRIVAAWYVLLLVLTLVLPGKKGYGLKTPAGYTLEYRVNGLAVFLVAHLIVLGATYAGIISLSAVVDELNSILALANMFGVLLSVFAYIKAWTFPSYPEDNKTTGFVPYDYLMGIEFNPRLGPLDLKLFTIGRVGMISWSMLNFCFVQKQYETFGQISNSMVLTVALQLVYIVDFFVREDWYLRTVDIGHDHFGYYLAWGCSVWLIWIYSASASYLSRNLTHLAWYQIVVTLVLAAFSYLVFLQSNQQKDLYRQTNGKCNVWGKPASGLRVRYTTKDGVAHDSILLTSGWWGVARHFNYFADMIFSFSIGLATGSTHAVAYGYGINMFFLLLHRSVRDEGRCRAKYGSGWDKYCQIVKYRIFPGIY
ncbi:7-dehydrocholesterol reductase [Porphyridium purpureum]|uniref:7-dehydrocholesterol reductase n=1 Tax=Porphyridium purpureum TaxID=35688 RepID=A0A5J4YVY9_PORPP|nr:7-dehydrocholesterol reductase [Porphyridium purpureum]|eukprot:POR7551..scf209_3